LNNGVLEMEKKGKILLNGGVSTMGKMGKMRKMLLESDVSVMGKREKYG
jgi:hypothetical protein